MRCAKPVELGHRALPDEQCWQYGYLTLDGQEIHCGCALLEARPHPMQPTMDAVALAAAVRRSNTLCDVMVRQDQIIHDQLAQNAMDAAQQE
jgi:hypothetical protein